MIRVCKSLVHALRYVRPGPVAGGPLPAAPGTWVRGETALSAALGTGRNGSAAQTTDTACCTLRASLSVTFRQRKEGCVKAVLAVGACWCCSARTDQCRLPLGNVAVAPEIVPLTLQLDCLGWTTGLRRLEESQLRRSGVTCCPRRYTTNRHKGRDGGDISLVCRQVSVFPLGKELC